MCVCVDPCVGGVGSRNPTATAATAPNAITAFNTIELLSRGLKAI
jgi:hypothetical protein